MPGTRAGMTRDKDNMRKMSEPELRIRVIPAIGDVAAADWDACANPSASMPPGGRFSQRANGVESASMCQGDSSAMLAAPAAGQLAAGTPPVAMPVDPKAKSVSQDFVFNPFITHDFLAALEASGSAAARAGWQPQHLIAETPAGEVVGVAPCYVKSHSQGEYVFDHAWADAYERAGGDYYPKLQVSVPFTPVSGPRLLVSPKVERETARPALVAGLRALREKIGASSIHLTFLPKADWDALGEDGLLQRVDQQFHWLNDGYAGFDDFLAALSSRKRKTIRRERRDALGAGITVEILNESEITEAHWDAFFAFYMDTGSRKWAARTSTAASSR